MAFAAPTSGSVLTMTINFVDFGGNLSQVTVKVPFDTDLATTINNAVTVAAAYAAASDAEVSEASVSVPLTDDAAAAAVSERHVEDQALLTAALVAAAGQSEYGNLRIPAPKLDIFQGATGPSANLIDVTDALVTDITDKYVETTGVAVLSDNQNIASPLSATGKRIHRASRKG